MANKFKKISNTSTKKKDDSTLRTAVGLGAVAMIAIILLFVLLFNKPTDTANSPTGNQAVSQTDLANADQAVTNTEQAASASPSDYNSQKNYADALYDAGVVYSNANNSNKALEIWNKAILQYQKALAIKYDINLQVDLATLAYYTDQVDLADSAFKKAIQTNPDFPNARLNYGVFLKDHNDIAGAKVQWEYVIKNIKDASSIKTAENYLKSTP